MMNRPIGAILLALHCAATLAHAQPVYNASPDWVSADTPISTGAALVDLDLDGWPDLVVSNGNDIRRERVVVYYNRGDGTFPPTPDWQSADIGFHGHLDVADVNGDGWPDVAVAVLLNEGGPAAKVYLNNAGTLSTLPDWTSAERARAFGVAFGDMNNDGRPDLAVATGWPYNSGFEARNTVHLNINGALETSPSWQSDDLNHYMGALWADADNDGWLDLIGVGANTDTWLYHNLGGTLETTASWHTTDNPGQFAIMATAGDVDADGNLDLFVTDNTQVFNGSGLFRRYDGLPGGFFTTTPTWTYFDGYGSAIALADVDNDNDLDLATGAWWDRTRLFFNDNGLYPSQPDWSSSVTSVVEKIVFGDIDRAAVRQRTAVLPGDGARRLFYLPHQPIEQVLAVRLDGQPLDPSEYTFSRELGWITTAAAPATTVEIQYTYSLSLDMAVSNWDDSVGNFVYYNRLPPPGPPGDFDGDGDVDIADFAFFSACFAGSGVPCEADCCDADLDGDGDVDIADFAIFSANFTGSQ